MTTTPPTPPDPAEWKRLQREAWSESAAAWADWSATVEAFASPINTELLSLARVAPGQSVLDVGCGTGQPSILAARVVGERGRVVGIDLAEPMIELARVRARHEKLGWVEFRADDAESLAEEGAYDAAVSRLALMLMPDPVRAASAVRRALRPGGRFAAAVWGDAALAPFCALAGDAAQRALDIVPPPVECVPGPLRLGAPGALAAVLEAAGFDRVEQRDLPVVVAFASAADCARFFHEVSASLRAMLAGRTTAERLRFAAELDAGIARYRGQGGEVRIPCTIRLASGRR